MSHVSDPRHQSMDSAVTAIEVLPLTNGVSSPIVQLDVSNKAREDGDVVEDPHNPHSNRDSGIQDGEFTEANATTYNKRPTELAVPKDPVAEVAQNWSRRDSLISRKSVITNASFIIDPKDELCGWGPISPSFCQKFRNPRWVLVWLSLAGVCQVCLEHSFTITISKVAHNVEF